MIATDHDPSNPPILKEALGNTNLLLQLLCLSLGVPTAIVGIAALAGDYWLESMFMTTAVLVAAYLGLTALSLLRS